MLSSKFDVERSKVKVMISGGSRAEFGGHVEREAYNGGLQGKAPISGVQGQSSWSRGLSVQGRRNGFESGRRQILRAKRAENFFDPPLFGQYGGTKYYLDIAKSA